MAEQQFYKPSRRSSREGDTADDVTFGAPNKGADALRRADDALGDIDSVLAENDQAMSGIDKDVLDGDGLAAAESGDPKADPKSPETAEAEQLPDGDRLGRGYTGKLGDRLTGLSRRQKTGVGIILGLAGGGSIFSLLFFGPVLRLESYMQRINQRAFSYASEAVETRTSNLFRNYMTTHILSLEGCKAVRSIDCRANYAGKGIASQLYATWQDAKVEEQIFDKMGFSIESTSNPNSNAGVHKFTLRDRRGRLITFSGADDWDRFVSGQFTGGSRSLGRELRVAIKDSTRWYDVMQRRSVRNYLERKHGVKLWCFLACKARDNVELNVADAKTKYKSAFVERFVYPISGKYGFIMDCLISREPGKGQCSVESLRNRGIDRDRVPDEVVARIVKEFETTPDLNLSQVIIKQLLEKVMSQTAAQATVSAIPVAGQIYFGLVVIDTFDKLNGFVESGGLGQYAAEVNASQYLEYYTGMRSFNDEMKSHAVGMDEVSTVMQEFEGAEDSKVYQAYNSTGAVTAGLFSQKAYAQAAGSDPDGYVCDDGDPIPEGEYVCEEKRLNRTYAIEDWRNNQVVDGIVDTLDNYDCISPEVAGHCPPGASPRSYIRPALGTIEQVSNSVFGTLADAAMSVVRALPAVGDIIKYVENKSSDLMQAMFGKVFPLPVSIDSPGREKYDGLEAGGDIAASQFGEGGYTDDGKGYGLGAPALSRSEASEIYQNFIAQQDYEYAHSGLIARLTNLSNPRSFASRLINTVPNNPNQSAQNLASSIINPFKLIGSLFGNISRPVSAQQAVAQNDINAFAITRYGYPASDPTLNIDPAELTPEFCEHAKAVRDLSATQNPETGFDEYSAANPCLLEEVVVEAAGGLFVNN